MTALLLALAASVSWGAADFLGGVGSRRARVLSVLAVSQLTGLLSLLVALALVRPAFFGADGLALAIAAGAGGVVGLGALYRGLAIGAMGVVAPISASAAVVPVVYGLARGERPAPAQLVGIGVVLVGVALASRDPGPLGPRVAAGVGVALLAAAGFGWYIVAIDGAGARDPLWALVVARSTSCILAVAAAGTRSALRLPRRLIPLAGAVGVLDVAANAALVLALGRGYISLVSVLASLYPVVTVGLAFAVLGERLARVQLAGAAVALAGVALIAAG